MEINSFAVLALSTAGILFWYLFRRALRDIEDLQKRVGEIERDNGGRRKHTRRW